MKALWMLLLMTAVLFGGAAIDLLRSFFTVAQGFYPIATAIFIVTSAFGLVGRLRA